MTDIERVARMIFYESFHPDEEADTLNHMWDELIPERDRAMRAAKAALKAIRQLSPKLCEVGLFANENALLLSASATDIANAHEAIISHIIGEG